jgi:hypothetical protein
MGLCLVATLGLAAVVAASAFAQEPPTWYECFKIHRGHAHTGNRNNKTCLAENTEGKGKYELREGVGTDRRFKGTGGPAVLHVAIGGGESNIQCAKSKSSAIPQLPNREIEVEVIYSKCTTTSGGSEEVCTSSTPADRNGTGGIKKGTIEFRNMTGELGYTDESPTGVGLKLDGLLTEFSCEQRKKPKPRGSVRTEGLHGTVSGNLIGMQEQDVDTASREATTVDIPTEHMGVPMVNILGFAEELAAIENKEQEPNILSTTLCGKDVEKLVGEECVDPYAGEEQVTTTEGEDLMIKTS